MFSRSELQTAWRGVLAHHRETAVVPDIVRIEERHVAFLWGDTVTSMAPERVAVPRPRGAGVRWLDVVDPHDEALYRAATARVARTVEARLGPSVVANRVEDASPALRLEPWRRAHRRFRAAATRLPEAGDVLVYADVRDCYGSIEPEVVHGSLSAMGCMPEAVDGVVRILCRFRDRGVRGLPVGPEPSAVLANAVLSGADRALTGAGCRHLRWVDDFVMSAPSELTARAILDRLRVALAKVGLEVAAEKSRIERGADIPGRVADGVSWGGSRA